MLGYNLKKELKKRKDPLCDEALLVINKLEKHIEELNERILRLEYDIDLPSLFNRIKELEQTLLLYKEALKVIPPIRDPDDLYIPEYLKEYKK